jgi:D-3-phosphoglycerate dehydrogenase / 2-oxoglutarate reductase
MTAPKVLISDKISQAAIDIFKNRNVDVDYKPGMTKDELIACIGEYDGLAIRSATKVDADVLAAATKLKVIGRAGIGVDNVDIPAATARGVIVMNTPFGNAITTAEHAIAMLFAASRQIGAADVSTQAGKWEKNRFNGVELYAKTLGIIGCGNIGSIVADRALGLKMKVVAFDPFLSPERALDIGVEKVELDELLARADAITMHVPLTAQTKNVLSAESLGKTKKGVIIVNCARGGLVDEAALAEHLKTGRVGAAAFDVFAEEPAKENVLFGCPNFTATPHLGAATTEAQENVALQVAEQIADYVLSGAITNALNTASVTAEEAPKLKPFVALAEKLGAFAGQIVDDGLEAIEIEYEGEVTGLNMKPLTASLIAGILKPLLSDINMVSAPTILKERGTPFSESKRDLSPTFDSVIRVKVQTGGKWRTVAGAVIGGQPRIVEIKGMPLEAPFHPIMLFINNSDTPGFIGALGMKLGAAGINIATFNLGRVAEGEDAIALVGIDQAVPSSIAAELKALPQVRYVKQLSF